jgi:glycosyltransferase involved in cell wall biosynthesis
VVGSYQRKLEEIAAHPDIELSVVVPPAWKETRGMLELERAHTEGYRLLVEPVRFNGNFHLHYYPGLARRFGEVCPQVVHIDEEPYNLSTYQALRLARRAGAKSVFFSWQNIFRAYPPPFSWMERRVLAQADAGIVGNRGAVEVWREKGYGGPLAVIPQFGVDTDIFAPGETGDSATHFRIGYAGRLVPEKGLDLLIKAVARLEGAWHLSILGDGPQRDELRTLAGLLNIGGSVMFEEPIPSTDMPGYYHRLDVLVLPSVTRANWKEQFGRVLVEAMACGVPVIGSDSGAIPEVIGEAGLVFPEGDVATLAGALSAVMWDVGVQRRLGEAGRRRVLERFTQKRVAQETVEVYRQVVGG